MLKDKLLPSSDTAALHCCSEMWVSRDRSRLRTGGQSRAACHLVLHAPLAPHPPTPRLLPCSQHRGNAASICSSCWEQAQPPGGHLPGVVCPPAQVCGDSGCHSLEHPALSKAWLEQAQRSPPALAALGFSKNSPICRECSFS